jgi:catechol 2,3-dioxygenase-like lactoylglutathione lyase family enzyme
MVPHLLTSLDASKILDAFTLVDAIGGSIMSRVQLALNVTDLDAAVGFYTKLFGVEPAKRRPGYANFAVAEPPLKLVLIENKSGRGTGVVGALNHLGVEVETPEDVQTATSRFSAQGLDPDVQESTTCCFAVQDKAWVNDPDGAPWEFYTVLADAPEESGLGCSTEGCAPVTEQIGPMGAASSSSCC